VMAIQIKTRIGIELFIVRTAALCMEGETQIGVGTNEGDQPVVLADWRIKYTFHRNAILIPKGVGIRDQA